MQRGVEDRPNQANGGAPADRLDSWKEVAAYLNRSVRTVQRWEREDGLPVYRRKVDAARKQQGQVFAYKPDLDAWWEGFRSRVRAREPWWRRSRRVYAALGAAAVAVVVAGTSLWHIRSRHPRLAEEQVAAWRFIHGEASPDGRWLAFRDPETGHLWLRSLSGQNQRLLAGEWVHESLAWSRDGARIAFVALGRAPYRTEILNVRSGTRRVVQQGAEGKMPPLPFDWTPDGKTLLGLSMSGRRELVFLPLENGPAAGRTGALEWRGRGRARISPDGRFLAYESRTESGSDIFVRRVEGNEPEVRVTDHPARDMHPVWSPDGRLLLFARLSRHGETQLLAVRFDPSTGAAGDEFEVRPAKRAALVLTPTITPGGELIEVRRGRDGEQVFLIELDPQSGRAAGAPKETFPESTFAETWSADGSKLYYRDFKAAFSYPANWRGKLYVERNIESGLDRMVPLQPADATFESFYWTALHPETRHLIWTAWEGSRFYWQDGLTGESGQAEVEHVVEESRIVWSPDARRVLFAGRRRGSQTHELVVLHVKEKRVDVLASGRWILQGAWSPDGSQVAYTDANCLKVVAASGGPSREIVCAGAARLPEPGQFPGQLANYLWFNAIFPSWSPDGKRLAWTVPVPEKKRVELWIVDAASGEREVAFAGETDYHSLPRGPLWSPSGRHIAFSMNWYGERQVWRLRLPDFANLSR